MFFVGPFALVLFGYCEYLDARCLGIIFWYLFCIDGNQMALQNSQDDWLEKQIESEREITRLEGEITHFKVSL